MLIDTTEKKEIAELILGLRQNTSRKSTLQLALESAKFHLGIKGTDDINYMKFSFRHNLVGQAKNGINTDLCSDEAELFSALLLYLNALEQIGTLFCKEEEVENGIKKAISAFCPKTFGEDETKAIKNLRNSLAHNFGLVNYNQRNKKPTEKFTICFDDKEEIIVELPKRKWEGSFKDKSDDAQCKIYVFPLIRMIEQIISKVKKQYKNDTLSFAIEDLEEIKARFTIKI
ncbi:hypothetical protein [Segatella maculosa]|uniref:Uncharacterized protein n=1 Tax=Segatella maculosa OT 289 TaxID=999422 RepID=H1HP21_9BACT|nr:hypothetical protein [Segatella maculosa]EHO68661.1 hypothetical protein HMPREF9944_01915 [Segatella maculosa OT 289]